MKRKFAAFLAMVMALSLFAVPVSANTAGTIGGESNIVVPDHVIEMTLPTQGFTFTVDPEGLIGANDPGAITFAGGSSPTFINRSSRTMRLGVELRITTAADPGPTQVIPVNTSAALTAANSTAKNVFIEVLASTGNVDDPEAAFVGTRATPLTAAAQTITFRLPAANFEAVEQPVGSGNFVRVLQTPPNLQGTRLNLRGSVNPNADWTGNEEMGIRVRFSFTDQGVGNAPAPVDPAAAHWVSLEAAEVFATMDVGPTATASFGGTGNTVLTINANGFEFPTGAYIVQIEDTRSATLTTVTSAVVNRVSASQVTITLTAAWAPGGTAQGDGESTRLVLTNGGYVVTVNRADAGLADVTSVSVDTP